MTRVFVYGSLLSGFHNHRLLEGPGAIPRGPATIPGGWFAMVSLGGFPGLVDAHWREQGAGPVVGELYAVDAPTLARLDVLEGVDRGLYRRDWVPVEAPAHADDCPFADGCAWVYVLVDGDRYDHAPLVAGNDWRALREARSDALRREAASDRAWAETLRPMGPCRD